MVLLLSEHQTVRTKNVVEPVPAYDELLPEVFPAQFVKFPAACLRQIVGPTYVVAVMNYAAVQYVYFACTEVVLVISLTRYAKKSAERTDSKGTAFSARQG